MLLRVPTPADLNSAAQQLIAGSGNNTIWLFEGEMGAGKTTLIKEICRQLGVHTTMSSPTFSIVNEYQAGNGHKIYHFDLYRLRNTQELLDIGFDEYLDSGHYCFIEWPHQVAYGYPPHITVSIHTQDGNSRLVSVA